MKKATMDNKELDNIFPEKPNEQKLNGHRGVITALAFHPVYTLIASCGEDATIKIWDMDTGKTEHTLRGHTA